MLETVSDKKIGVDNNADGIIDYYNADVITANDYYPFGSQMPGRKYSQPNSSYRYGFNGQENDNEVKGEGNQQDYGMRAYDSRLGRLMSIDPLDKQYPYYTPYQFAGNKPIKYIDKLGAQEEKSWLDFTFTDLMHWFEKPANPMVTDGFVHKFSSSFNRNLNPGYYLYVTATGDDPVSSDFQKMGRMDAAAGLTTMIILHKSFGMAAKPSPAVALEQQGAKNAAAMGSTNAVKTVINDETTSATSGGGKASTLQVGEYSKMVSANTKSGMSADHIPSFAALKKYSQDLLGRELTSTEAKALRKSSLTIVYDTKIHQTISRTFAGRNNPVQIAKDASNLVGAIVKDINALTPSLLKAGYTKEEIGAAQKVLTEKYLPK